MGTVPDNLRRVELSQEMTRVSALERDLVATERELHALLVRVLPACIENGTMVFFNSENLPDDYQHHWLAKESDELFELASRCLSIRSELRLPIAQTLAQIFLDACAESSNMHNPHRRGPRKLATWLLAEIGSRFPSTA
jgi:hypothetical protein